MKTLLVDSKFLLYRSLNAKINLTHNEIKTSCYYLFFNSLQSVANKMKVDNTILMWDSNYSYRREIYPEYKRKDKQKNKVVEEQIKMIELEYAGIKHTMKNLGFASFNRRGYEADDLFALYTRQHNDICVILTRDDDLLQLLDAKRVIIYNPMKKKKITEKWFKKEYGIEVKDWPLFKAICGCKSDNVKGVPGIANGRTLQYLKKEASDKINKKISEHKKLIEFNLKLVTLPFKQEDSNKNLFLRKKKTNLKMDKFISLCQILGFRSFLENLNRFEVFRDKDHA
ncbi:MAG: hypothetical protein RBR32_06745 [Bacteroidales bacterium]|nr:hypothetical protein [Bacteroidales bacterium]